MRRVICLWHVRRSLKVPIHHQIRGRWMGPQNNQHKALAWMKCGEDGPSAGSPSWREGRRPACTYPAHPITTPRALRRAAAYEAPRHKPTWTPTRQHKHAPTHLTKSWRTSAGSYTLWYRLRSKPKTCMSGFGSLDGGGVAASGSDCLHTLSTCSFSSSAARVIICVPNSHTAERALVRNVTRFERHATCEGW